MANEAIIVELLGNKGDPIRYSCADGIAIPKGTVMELETPRSVIPMSAAGKPFAGYAASEKVANDGQTSIAVYTNCIVLLRCGTTQCEIGQFVITEAAVNTIKLGATLDFETAWTLGRAMETIAIGHDGLVRTLVV